MMSPDCFQRYIQSVVNYDRALKALEGQCGRCARPCDACIVAKLAEQRLHCTESAVQQ
jgi:hypothetical protein